MRIKKCKMERMKYDRINYKLWGGTNVKEITVQNPVLKGFNPDPSMIYVKDTFYIATSTFEYKPGVVIHYSKDLVEWEQMGVLENPEYLNLTGIPASGGIWAPCLRYHEEEQLFYLLYTKFKSSYTPPFRDQDNYLITAPDIRGPWSQPVHINASGYDPAIFFDDDGKAYITNMLWDYRPVQDKRSAGIVLQEYDWKNRKMVGEPKMMFEGTEVGQTEGPSIYKKDGWYYLMTAEGGPSYEHRVTLCRSRNIWGPYELHPDTYILTSSKTDSYLQKAGHASICQDKNGRWYISYLCSRPLDNQRCVLGRETAVQEVEWKEDGWLYLKNGKTCPDNTFTVWCDDHQMPLAEKEEITYTFDNDDFWSDFMTLREPTGNGRFSLTDRPGYLRMYGRDSINSVIEQSILVRRQTAHDFEVTVEMDFDPKNFAHMAGLIYRYSEANQHYCFMSRDEEKGNVIGCITIDRGRDDMLPESEWVVVNGNHVYIKVVVNGAIGQFYCSEDNISFVSVGNTFDASILSDDYAYGFTGAMVGMACQDLMFHTYPADFKSLIYKEI